MCIGTVPPFVQAGKGQVPVGHMHSFPACAGFDDEELRSTLDRDGYIYVRGWLPEKDVEEAREFLLQHLRQRFPLAPKGPHQNSIGLIHRQDLASAAPVRRVLEHDSLFHLLQRLLGEEVITTGFKWLRAVGDLEFTGVHMDRVFVGGSRRMLTIWIPIGDVPIEQGPIMVCPGSHRLPAFQGIQRSYGESKVGADGTLSGWLYDDGSALARDLGIEVDWRTADFQSGDIVVVDSRILHMSATNISGQMRLSCDTRWQPRSDVRDPRLGVWHEHLPD